MCTNNAARVLGATARLLGVDDVEFSSLALEAPSGAGGLVVVPYLEGERTPNLPHASGTISGLRLATWDRAHLARAAVEGMLCGLAVGIDALLSSGVRVDRVVLIGGASRSEAVRQIAAGIFGRPVIVPAEAEYVALGAARQAAWTLSGEPEPPAWGAGAETSYEAPPQEFVRAQYARAADEAASRLEG